MLERERKKINLCISLKIIIILFAAKTTHIPLPVLYGVCRVQMQSEASDRTNFSWLKESRGKFLRN